MATEIARIEEIELEETIYKTKRKFKKTGTLRLENHLMNSDFAPAMEVLENICEAVDCNFMEVLDAVNRTVR